MAGASDPLAQLHPLHNPPPIGWWPLAWGWWALIVLGVVLIMTIGLLLWRKHRRTLHNRYRTEGLQLLAEALATHGNSDPIAYLHELNSILKRVALVTYGEDAMFNNTTVPALHGNDWVAFLDSGVTSSLFTAQYRACLTDDIYRGSLTPGVALPALHAIAEQWIRTHV